MHNGMMEPAALTPRVSQADIDVSQAARALGGPNEGPFVREEARPTETVRISAPPESASAPQLPATPGQTPPKPESPQASPPGAPAPPATPPSEQAPEGFVPRQIGARTVYIPPESVQAFDAQAAQYNAQNALIQRQAEQHRQSAVDANRQLQQMGANQTQTQQQAQPVFNPGIPQEIMDVLAQGNMAAQTEFEGSGKLPEALDRMLSAVNTAFGQMHEHFNQQVARNDQNVRTVHDMVRSSAEAIQPIQNQTAMEAYFQQNMSDMTDPQPFYDMADAIRNAEIQKGSSPEQLAQAGVVRLIHSTAESAIRRNAATAPAAPPQPPTQPPASQDYPAPPRGPEQPRSQETGRFETQALRGSARSFV